MCVVDKLCLKNKFSICVMLGQLFVVGFSRHAFSRALNATNGQLMNLWFQGGALDLEF